MLNPREFVSQTKSDFKGKWSDSFINAILANVFSLIIIVYYTAIFFLILMPFAFMRHDGGFTIAFNTYDIISDWELSHMGLFEFLFLVITIVIMLIHSIIQNQFSLKRVKYNLDLVNGNAQASEMIDKFKWLLNPKNIFSIFLSNENFYLALIPTITGLLFTLIYLIGSVLLFIPGIIVMLGLSLLSFLQVDNPTAKPMALIKKSWQLMEGNKMVLFTIFLYSIPYVLLGFITCGIGFFWVIPFFSFLMARFYLSLGGDKLIDSIHCVKMSSINADQQASMSKETSREVLIVMGVILLPLLSWMLLPNILIICSVFVSLIFLKWKKLNKLFASYLFFFSVVTSLYVIAEICEVRLFGSIIYHFDEQTWLEFFYRLLIFLLVSYSFVLYMQFLSLMLNNKIIKENIDNFHVKSTFYKYFRLFIVAISLVCILLVLLEKYNSKRGSESETTSNSVEQNENFQEERNSLNTENLINSNNTQNITQEDMNKGIADLVNYGEFESNTNGFLETLYFSSNEKNELFVEYSSKGGKRREMVVKKDENNNLLNILYFPSKSNEFYKIENIKVDNTGFDIVNPDGSRQSFIAIEH